MTEDELRAARRMFLEWLQQEEIWRDPAGREVGRFVRAVSIDPIGGTAVIRRHEGDTRAQLVALEIGLDALGGAWDRLVHWGRDALVLATDERNALGYLLVLLDEAVDSGALDDVDRHGADDLVLQPNGLFGPR